MLTPGHRAVNINCPATLNGSFPYQISAKSSKQLERYMENSIMVMCKIDFIVDQHGQIL
jgi:hypothetical protein